MIAPYEDQIETRDVTPEDFGRIAAQTAKQVILQRIREAERQMMYDEYQDRVGELITGIIQQSDKRYTLVQLRERVEALLPKSEQVYNERYDHGMRVKAVITDVSDSTKGPAIVVSRRSPELIKSLFELEVPEIADKLVEIVGVAREPGYRSKIAVVSHADGVDPVGACVGPRGSRVRMVVSELRGEKIDIIPHNDEPARFVAKALSPARVREVIVDDEERQATVIVPDDQLSLAIGRDGQNARLAARLTGWRVDIKSETEFASEEQDIEFEGEEAFDGRCMAVLSNGRRCPNAAIPGSTYCGLPAHQALSRFETSQVAMLAAVSRGRGRDPRRPRRRRGPGRGDRHPRPPRTSSSRGEAGGGAGEARPRPRGGVEEAVDEAIAEEAAAGGLEEAVEDEIRGGDRRGGSCRADEGRRGGGAGLVAKKRVHEIAKAQGVSSKELLAALKAAGVEAKAAASSVEEADALKAIAAAKGNGGAGRDAKRRPSRPRPSRPAAAAPQAETPLPPPRNAAAPKSQTSTKPVRAAGAQQGGGGGGGGAAKKRRVVIDSQAARRDQMGGPPPQRPPRRRGGRRRRPLLEEPPMGPDDARSSPRRPRSTPAPPCARSPRSLGLAPAEVIKKLMMMGEMATLTQTLTDDSIRAIADEYDRKLEIVTAADEEPRGAASSTTPRRTSSTARRW